MAGIEYGRNLDDFDIPADDPGVCSVTVALTEASYLVVSGTGRTFTLEIWADRDRVSASMPAFLWIATSENMAQIVGERFGINVESALADALGNISWLD